MSQLISRTNFTNGAYWGKRSLTSSKPARYDPTRALKASLAPPAFFAWVYELHTTSV